MKQYNHKEIENKWQKHWEEIALYKTTEGGDRPTCYVLDMFPYPSGEGLHVGHPKGYIGTDVYGRYKTMMGYNVLHPMGWDAFGLPAENYAIKNKIHPRVAVEKNIARYKEQLRKIGFTYDWSREINTTDPAYYKWTQWIFVQLFKKGLAYESHEPINWCPSCKTGLALEDLDGGLCERCGDVVEQKPLRQWVLKIRDYADRLLADLDDLAWPESVKESQRNWIGRSEGAELTFQITSSKEQTNHKPQTTNHITVFTTRPDTLFGATYMVLAPEHPFIEKNKKQITNYKDVVSYIEGVKSRSDIERTAEDKEKTGVRLEGMMAVNPATGEEIPVYIADYVLVQYGTGAIMSVPAHDERDFAFAKKYNLNIKSVVAPIVNSTEPTGRVIDLEDAADEAIPFVGEGILVRSGDFSYQKSAEAKRAITESVGGELAVTYRLRDWVFSRQRYWGEPIPIIHCDSCGPVAVPEEDLPVTLPEVDSYEPTGTGESPLAGIQEWVNTDCPSCDGAGRRETNTMPQWAGSSWYYLRFMDPHNDMALVDPQKETYWAPVDMYVGGTEHATRHLIYARFWHKFLYDIDVVSTKEPFAQLKNQGLIGGDDGRKMSKRFGNVVNPDDVIATFGADTFRLYEMFMGPFEEGGRWSTDSIIGPRRFIEKVWRLQEKLRDYHEDDTALLRLLNKTIKKVGEDIDSFSFNTAVSALMIMVGDLEKHSSVSREVYHTLLRLCAPFAPYVSEELWAVTGGEGSIHRQVWPSYDEAMLEDEVMTIAVQVNGKVRADFEVARGASEEEVREQALTLEKVVAWTSKGSITKVIYVKGRLVNIVVT